MTRLGWLVAACLAAFTSEAAPEVGGDAEVADLDVFKVDLYLDDVLVVENGARCRHYMEADAQRVMKQSEIVVRVVLHRGRHAASVWTCDLSHDYVSINADYRS